MKNCIKKVSIIVVSLLAGFVTLNLLESDVHAQKNAHENPKQINPDNELIRLRNEGVANYEGGIALQKALVNFEAALSLKPNSAIEHYNLAVINRKLGKNEVAKSLLQKTISLDKNLPHGYYVMAIIYKSEGNYVEALKMFEETKRLAPSEASVYYQLALLYRDGKKEEFFLQSLIHALQFNPYHTGALYQLAQYYQGRNEKERAQEIFREFSRLKKIASQSRKELQEDASILFMPIRATDSDVGSRAAHDKFKAIFRDETINLPDPVTAFDLRDVDDDGDEDIVLATTKNQILILFNQGYGKFDPPLVFGKKVNIDVRLLVVEKFSAKEGSRVLVGGKQGMAMSGGSIKSENKEWITLSNGAISTVTIFDLDHDGDLDIAGSPFDEPWLNRGNGDFYQDKGFYSDLTIHERLNHAVAVVASDFGNRGGVDLLVYDKKGERHLLQDAHGGLYELGNQPLVNINKLQWVDKADMDDDGRSDIVSLNRNQLFIDFNQEKYRFKQELIGNFSKKDAVTTGAISDYDNDGLKDIMVFQEGQPPLLWLNTGQRKFDMVPVDVKLVRALKKQVAHDINDDGRIDLLVLSDDGLLHVWYNHSIGVGNWIKVNLQGVRSAPSGIFSQIEVRKGAWYSKYESSGRTIHLGIGREDYVEILRITWPNGFVENKFKIDAKNTWSFRESERISGSCPSIFAWNGDRFGFVTDAFISGPMGVPLRKGVYFPVDHDEYIKISRDQLQMVNGKYHIRITEELREAVYLDQVRLLAIDHPSEIEIYPNEALGLPSFSEFGIHGTSHAHPPVQAIDHHGNNVLTLIEKIDGEYPDNIERSIYTGFSEPQGIVMTLPKNATDSDYLRLFLTGWFYYFDSTSLISASQSSNISIIWPHIQAFQNGQWETIAQVGIPPGKNKTVVVDLSGKLQAGTTQIRVWTNIELYWDRILIDTEPPQNEGYILKEIPLEKARVRFRGFSRRLESVAGEPQPERFDYQDIGYLSIWNPMSGKYTRYGDVLPLLKSEDSQMVVFGLGDEIVLEFDTDSFPAQIEGLARDFLLYLNGFVKDGDKHTAHAGKIDPMPFSGMESYPYSTQDNAGLTFRSQEYIQYLRDFQTRDSLTFVGPILSLDSK